MNLQNEKVIISYCESLKKRDYFEELVEVHLEELTTKELEKAKESNRWLFDRIVEECIRLAESVSGLAHYEVTLFYKVFDSEENDFITEEEKTFYFYVKNSFVCDSKNLEQVQKEFKEEAKKEFCSKNNIDYIQAKKEVCENDFIEEQAKKQGILFASVEINNIYEKLEKSLLNEMYNNFIEELQSTY